MSLPALAAWNVRGFNNPNKAKMCKDFIASFNLKLLGILEAKIHPSVHQDPWFHNSRVLFDNEMCCDNFTCSNPGRIWVKWDFSHLSFNPSFISSQVIHGLVQAGSIPPFYLSVVYAANELGDRRSLWDDLLNLSVDEKAGGNLLTADRLGELNNFIFEAGVHDLASVGLFFTWFNQRADNPIHIKLDRMLVNSAFLDLFPTAYYRVTEHLGSDHSPLILSVDASPIVFFYDCLKRLKMAVKSKRWSSSNFISNGILEFKNRQYQLLSDIQSDPLNPTLNASLKETNDDLASFQSAWYSWIAQRAKAYWLSLGEDDLGFLYIKIRARKNRNMIKELVGPSGLISSHDELAASLISHFKGLYNMGSPPCENSFNIMAGSQIPHDLIHGLTQPVSDEEIKNVVFAGKATSAPGPDGFSFGFYQKTWHIIGFHLCRAVRHFFTTGVMPKVSKATAITLIPKGTHSNAISDFRPISLCNVFYKIVAKILANRLKPILPFIIHESQSGFISKRCSTDNIILASEILREFKGNHKYFCAKLDIKKAFDSVSRTFLINRLRQKGFPEVFIKWIHGCIGEVHFSVCLNGVLEGFFPSKSGLRQGCPLSPLLFCIVMDALSSCLDANEDFVGIRIKNLNINHLMYADDLLVFGLADLDNVSSLNGILKTFADASGLHINPLKSSLIISRNLHSDTGFANTLGISRVEDFITYLGIPISTTRLKFSHFQPLLSRISTLLAGWKVKFLSFAVNILPSILLSVHSRSNLSFLWDPWCKGKAIADLYYSAALENSKVNDFIVENRWELPFSIPYVIRAGILEINILGDKPVISWEGSPSPPSKKVLNAFYGHLDNVIWHKFVWHKRHALRLDGGKIMRCLKNYSAGFLLNAPFAAFPLAWRLAFWSCWSNQFSFLRSPRENLSCQFFCLISVADACGDIVGFAGQIRFDQDQFFVLMENGIFGTMMIMDYIYPATLDGLLATRSSCVLIIFTVMVLLATSAFVGLSFSVPGVYCFVM
ncbi:uncharacterized protein LOC110104200 [Dendrobium catenatum]|uniref:uncharacterized protein LOC110104200 n=1 Tax=Dendrobium catenatum TaxID=906689 RepID=UPI0010A08077|nr:uncharacterized protein LOC110104200 [Dendrobium catenatum]